MICKGEGETMSMNKKTNVHVIQGKWTRLAEMAVLGFMLSGCVCSKTSRQSRALETITVTQEVSAPNLLSEPEDCALTDNLDELLAQEDVLSHDDYQAIMRVLTFMEKIIEVSPCTSASQRHRQ